MKKHKFLLIFLVAITCSIFTSSCGTNNANMSTIDSTTPSATLIEVTVSPKSFSSTITSELASTSDLPTITATSTIAPTNTATLVPPTMTPIPTLPPDQAQEMVVDLLKNNAGCELPCYWGITPGETSWQEAYNFLASFAERIEHRVVDVSAPDGSEQSITVIGVHNTIPGYDEPVSSGYQVTNGIIGKISASGSGTELRYQLHQVLDRYGLPDEVLLFLTDVSHGGGPWFSIYIFYEEIGVTLFYSAAAQMKGNSLEVCPEGVGPEINLIIPGSLTLRQMIRERTNGVHFPSINEFPGKNVEFFYETLKEPGSCITFDPAE